MIEVKVIRWLGVICLLAGIARMGMTPAAIGWGVDSPQELTFGYTACILMAVGTLAIYLVQARETGVLGFIAALAITVGNVLTAALVFVTFIFDPNGPAPEGLVVDITGMGSFFLITGGMVLMTLLMFRAKVFPRWVAGLFALMLLAGVVPIDDYKYFALFWGLSYVGAGFCIWKGKLQARARDERIGLSA